MAATHVLEVLPCRRWLLLPARRIGARTSDRTASGFWPSDHAGVVAVFELGDDDDKAGRDEFGASTH